MGEKEPPETQSPSARGRDAAVQGSVRLASPDPHAERKPALRAPLPGDSDRHFRAALDAGTRASSSLSELDRSIADLRSGLGVAADANLHLGQELGALRSVLELASAQQRRLGERVTQLEQELAAAEHERKFLIAQQDEFLAALLDEHEAELRARDARETSPTSAGTALDPDALARAEVALLRAEQEAAQARAELAATQAARDEARALASKYGLERDALRAEASRLRASLGAPRSSSNPPAPSAPRPPSFGPGPALRLDQGELDSTLHARRSTPLMPAVVPRFTPSLLPAGATGASDSAPPVATVFPRESTRPGVGGPKASEPPRASFGPSPSAWTPAPPAPEATVPRSPWPVSAASLPPEATPPLPILKRKPDPTTRPLTDYSLGEGGVQSETLEGAQLRSSNPPRK